MRIGQVPSTQETLAFWSLQLGGGATFFAIRSSASRPVEVDLRADVFGTDLVVARGNATQQRWVPEARLEIEGTWFLWPPSIGVVGAAGVEATIGTTDVAVGNDIVAVLHPFRSIGSLGIRVRF
jgi:hypothetical protein